MARYRVNPNAICSSKNYKQSKKLHMDMLKRNHEVFMEMVIKEEIVIKRQAYIMEVILFIVALVFHAIILYIIFDYCNKS